MPILTAHKQSWDGRAVYSGLRTQHQPELCRVALRPRWLDLPQEADRVAAGRPPTL